jgi:O-antigen/teichoic acid export membrane protein
MSTPPESSLSQRATSGFAWSMFFQVSRQLLSVASVLVLARRVPPAAYGLMSMATVVTNFIDIFRDLGTGNALIREKEVSGELLSTVFWLNLALGAILSTAVLALSTPAALFFAQPSLAPIMRVLASVFLIYSLGVVQTSLLNRGMAFRSLAIVQLVGAAFGTLVAIVAAVMDAGVWSLVLGALVSNSVTTAALWLVCPWRPRGVIDFQEIRGIASYSLHLSAFNFMNYFSRNADNLIVGRFLGDVQLGYYQMAYTLMTYPLSNFSSVIAGVVLPGFSKLQNDDARLRSAFIRVSMLVGVVIVPVMLGLTVVAGPFVRVVLGAKWQPVTGLLIVFAPLGMLQAIYTLVGPIYNAKGRTDRLFYWGLLSSSVYVLSFLFGLRWGIQGVATSYAIAWLLLMIPGFSIPLRLMHLSWRDLLTHLWPEFLAGSLMAAITFVWLRALSFWGITSDKAVLASAVAIGTIVYVGILLWWRPPVVGELHTVLESAGYPRLARLVSRRAKVT